MPGVEAVTAVEFDENNRAIPGTYPLWYAKTGMEDQNGPVPVAISAICDVCDGWATEAWCARNSTKRDQNFTDVRIRRTASVVVYACPKHADEVAEALCDEWGGSHNRYAPDKLAILVTEHDENAQRWAKERS